jgi:hypothetical protein
VPWNFIIVTGEEEFWVDGRQSGSNPGALQRFVSQSRNGLLGDRLTSEPHRLHKTLASNALEMLGHDLCPRCGLWLQKDRKSKLLLARKKIFAARHTPGGENF